MAIVLLFLSSLSVQVYEEREELSDIVKQAGEIQDIQSNLNLMIQPRQDKQESVYYPGLSLSKELQLYTFRLCRNKETDLDLNCNLYELVLAVMWNESGYDTQALNLNSNGTYDRGLCQINDCMDEWIAENLSIKDVMIPEDNILICVTILSDYILRYGEHDGLMAYGNGPAGMQNLKKRGIDTTDAVQRVLKKKREIMNMHSIVV